MNVIGLCQQCSSINTSEIKSESIAGWLLKVAGCRSLCCKNCGFRWNQFLPLNILLNLIYLLLIMEVGFLLLNYIH